MLYPSILMTLLPSQQSGRPSPNLSFSDPQSFMPKSSKRPWAPSCLVSPVACVPPFPLPALSHAPGAWEARCEHLGLLNSRPSSMTSCPSGQRVCTPADMSALERMLWPSRPWSRYGGLLNGNSKAPDTLNSGSEGGGRWSGPRSQGLLPSLVESGPQRGALGHTLRLSLLGSKGDLAYKCRILQIIPPSPGYQHPQKDRR